MVDASEVERAMAVLQSETIEPGSKCRCEPTVRAPLCAGDWLAGPRLSRIIAYSSANDRCKLGGKARSHVLLRQLDASLT